MNSQEQIKIEQPTKELTIEQPINSLPIEQPINPVFVESELSVDLLKAIVGGGAAVDLGGIEL